ncbi:nucleoside diphosphate-linked moiety X motif 13 [Polypterus senegalus]|uniref:nucleoside diphosphate-linked moiety X motif 13 n=1 Tax=Polypterus senegalus TaxID=55291 RepID=UPI0019667813|nr:nucleoside diphosphate-linked moiety X motif 13 [Polypterus senegalus]
MALVWRKLLSTVNTQPLNSSLFLYGHPLVRCCSSYVSQMRFLTVLKEDDDACSKAQASGKFLLFHNLSPLLQKEGHEGYSAPLFAAADVKGILGKLGQSDNILETSVLIGCSQDSETQFALDLGILEMNDLDHHFHGTFVELRKAFFLLRRQDIPLVFRSQALLRWHQTHQYCSQSGKPTERNRAGSQRICKSNGNIYYPQMAPVVISLVSDGTRCLLARQKSFPKGMYSALAGFCDIGETVEETVRREVAEEVGLEIESLWYTGSQHWPFPNSSLMIACHATVSAEKSQITVNDQELEDARWFTADEIKRALERKKLPREQEAGIIPFWVPPRTAIANQLIQEWINKQSK